MTPLKPNHYLILLLLSREPTYGVELLQRLDEASGGAVRLNAGSLYRLIGQLENQGYVTMSETAPAEGGHGAPRKIYRVTDSGRSALGAEARRQADLLEIARSLDLLGESSGSADG